jgi:hypothetical protein
MGLGGCPISRATYKKDVHYLTSLERSTYAAELLDLKLTTYRYIDDPEGKPHLGFIIEDVEPSVLAESTRNRVDLYGYASMTVAAVQEQAKRIDDLNQELEDVRRQLLELSKRCK